jgi:hypothetical protein
MFGILPFQRVTDRAQAQGEDLLIPAGTAYCGLDPLLQSPTPSFSAWSRLPSSRPPQLAVTTRPAAQVLRFIKTLVTLLCYEYNSDARRSQMVAVGVHPAHKQGQ